MPPEREEWYNGIRLGAFRAWQNTAFLKGEAMLMPISRAADELGLIAADLVVLIRNLPGAPFVLKGDMMYADPYILGPFLNAHGVPVTERYAGIGTDDERADDEEEDSGSDDVEGVDDDEVSASVSRQGRRRKTRSRR